MPSSHQRAISSLLANGWKLAGFLWQYASLKIGRGQPWGQLLLHFMGTLEAHVLVCRGFGEKSLRSGVMLALGQKKTSGQDLNFLRTRQGPKRTSIKKNTVNSHGGMQDTHTAETPIQCLQQNYMEMSTSGLTPPFVVWFMSGMNFYHCFVLFRHHNHNRHTRHR